MRSCLMQGGGGGEGWGDGLPAAAAAAAGPNEAERSPDGVSPALGTHPEVAETEAVLVELVQRRFRPHRESPAPVALHARALRARPSGARGLRAAAV